MEILIGKTAGFCYGVQRAVEGTKNQINNKKIYCLGELVHNKQVINELEDEGVEFINNLDEIKEVNSKLIIRAHGVPNKIYIEAKNLDIDVQDYTCPNVIKIHEIAEEYVQKGYFIFLCGKQNHPENIGTISYCGKSFAIIEDEEMIEEAIECFKKSNLKKVLIIAQTTYSVKKFDNIQEKVKIKLKGQAEIIIKSTICRATELRQKETEELSKKVECMLIIGGKNSSNTIKLVEVAKVNCKNTFHIEIADELKQGEISQYNVIGIMAGASTPRESIDKVVEKIKSKECMKI